MAQDTSKVEVLQAPKLEPLKILNRLANAPKHSPKYATHVKNVHGEEVKLADPVVTRALVALMDMHAVNGGAACHWGGPAALAEIMSALHGILFSVQDRPWYEAYNFVNDAGHTENGIYALRANYGFDGLDFEELKQFRSVESKLTGHGEAHLNPEGVLLSNGPLASALPQAQGLAMADKLLQNDRLTFCVVSDGAAMEGEAKEAFAAIPGLAKKGKMNPFVLVLSDNDTKLSGRISADSFSMKPTFEAFGILGWQVIRVENGHDLQTVYLSIEKAIEQAKKQPDQPVCLWVKTIKGYGVRSTEQNSAGGHGFPLSSAEKIVDFVNEICAGNPPTEIAEWALSLKKEWEQKEERKKAALANAATAQQVSVSSPAMPTSKVQAGLAEGAIAAAKEGYPVFSVSADLAGSTGMSTFQKTFPDRWIDIGVAESNMISTAAGLSKAGLIPIADTFAQFGITKGNLPLIMASLSQAPIIAVFSHIGFQDAADGASHQATTYFAAVSSIPHTVVIAPSCAEEARAWMHQAIRRVAEARTRGEDGESVIFFVGRENYPISYQENASYEWGKAQILTEGTKLVIATTGTLVGKALEAQRILEKKGMRAAVVHVPFVNRPDVETFIEVLSHCHGRLLTVEDHQIVGGMGAQLIHALTLHGVTFKAKTLGVRGEFGQSAYVADHLYHKHGLDGPAIAHEAELLIKQDLP